MTILSSRTTLELDGVLLSCFAGLPSLGWFIDGGNADEMVMEEGLEDEALAERRGGLRDHGQGGGIDPGGDAGRSERYVRVFCGKGSHLLG